MSDLAVPLILLGPGGVGCALLQQVVAGRRPLSTRRGLRLAVAAVHDSRGGVYAPPADAVAGANGLRELDDAALSAVVGAKEKNLPVSHVAQERADLAAVEHQRAHTGSAAWQDHLAGGPGVVVDCTASARITPLLVAALEHGWHVALANKLPLVGPWADFARIAARRARALEGHDVQAGRAMWEATVGSALPIVASLERLLDAGDAPRRIEGTFSGTLNFMTNGLRAGRAFGELVREAQARKYTEPDPRTDLGGVDMARKALILARMAGLRLELSDVEVTSLHPATMDELSLEDFIARVDEADEEVGAMVERAIAEDGVLRYVARIDLQAGRCAVGPRTVPAESPLGRLEGTDNLVTIHSRWYEPEPLVLQGRGAGVEATAAGVLADVVALAAGR